MVKNKINFVLGLLIILCVSGCYSETKESFIYYFENNSGHALSVQQPTIDNKIINIDNGRTFEWSSEYYDAPFDGVEEVSVVFNSNRILKYTPSLPLEDNILLDSGYTIVQKVKKNGNWRETKFYYTFTPEMYESATPLEP